MEGVDFQQLAGRVACSAASIIEGRSCLVGRGAVGGVNSLKNGLGGALRFVHVGMAPATGDPIRRFHAQGIAMYEAYGVTEAGMVAWNRPYASRKGSLGKPVNPHQVFLDGAGEVVFRRKWPLCLGYFETSQDDRDITVRSGDIATGDLGEFDDDGFLYLRGMSKDQIVLPSGVSLRPETIEQEVRKVGCCLAFFDAARRVLQCHLVSADGRMAELPVAAIRDAVLIAVGQPLDIEVVNSTVMSDAESGTLTRNLKIRRRPMATWIEARLANQGVRLQRHFFACAGLREARFIDHLPTIQQIEGNNYLVVRIADRPATSAFAALQHILRERLGSLGEACAKQALIPASLLLPLGEWHGRANTDALLRLVRQWSNAQGPLSLCFEGLQALPVPYCLLLASARADQGMRDALQALRTMARSEGPACVEQVPVDAWLFHVSPAHCPDVSPEHWQSVITNILMQLTQIESLHVTQVELVHYRRQRELPAQVVQLHGQAEIAS